MFVALVNLGALVVSLLGLAAVIYGFIALSGAPKVGK